MPAIFGLAWTKHNIAWSLTGGGLRANLTKIHAYHHATNACRSLQKEFSNAKNILILLSAQGWGEHDVIGYALAEDGTGLASHLSGNKDFSKHDMGLTSKWKHESYEALSRGFELEWVDDPDNHPGVAAAYALLSSPTQSQQGQVAR